MDSKFSIKNWSLDDQPRNKLLTNGRKSLSDAELIAILLGSGNKELNALELAKLILRKVENNLNELGKLSVADLRKFKGVGEAKAIAITAALELGRRRKQVSTIEKQQLLSSIQAFELMRHLLEDLNYEEFWVLLLNRQNKVLNKVLIGRGGIAGTVADVRLIFKAAIEQLASGIILFHNHPSGTIDPSNNDIQLTQKIVEAGKILDIQVYDHIIIGDDSYFSFSDKGMI